MVNDNRWQKVKLYVGKSDVGSTAHKGATLEVRRSCCTSWRQKPLKSCAYHRQWELPLHNVTSHWHQFTFFIVGLCQQLKGNIHILCVLVNFWIHIPSTKHFSLHCVTLIYYQHLHVNMLTKSGLTSSLWFSSPTWSGISGPGFLCYWCPSYRPTNSVKSLKERQSTAPNDGKCSHWPRLSFIRHHHPERRLVAPLMSALQCKYT